MYFAKVKFKFLQLYQKCVNVISELQHEIFNNVECAQELEVRSVNHPYSLKTKSSQCHYVVMTRNETKFQAPLNRCCQEVLAKTEHLTIKSMSTGHARHG